MYPRSFAFRIFSQQLPRCSGSARPAYSNPAWRYFTSSALRTKATATGPKPPGLSKPGVTRRRPQGFTLFEREVAKEKSLQLYEAPNHRRYLFGCYTVAVAFFAMAVNFADIAYRRESKAPTWIKITHGAVSFVASVMGTIAILKTARLVKSISAFRSHGQTYLRVTSRRLIPFAKPLTFDVHHSQVSVASELVASPEVARATLAETQRLMGVSFFKAPLKRTNLAFWRLFKGVRQVWTEEDFIKLTLEGQGGRFRMDSNGSISKHLMSALGKPFGDSV